MKIYHYILIFFLGISSSIAQNNLLLKADKNFNNLLPTVKKYLKPKGIITYYNPFTKEVAEHTSKINNEKVIFNHVSVNPPTKEMKYKYFTKKDYYCIKIVVD